MAKRHSKAWSRAPRVRTAVCLHEPNESTCTMKPLHTLLGAALATAAQAFHGLLGEGARAQRGEGEFQQAHAARSRSQPPSQRSAYSPGQMLLLLFAPKIFALLCVLTGVSGLRSG